MSESKKRSRCLNDRQPRSRRENMPSFGFCSRVKNRKRKFHLCQCSRIMTLATFRQFRRRSRRGNHSLAESCEGVTGDGERSSKPSAKGCLLHRMRLMTESFDTVRSVSNYSSYEAMPISRVPSAILRRRAQPAGRRR
ncbi:hypothetical protein RJ55_04889 [Drechmeria coniospora]|nr:hypothetical protein RJ55_04889 [Drechmeria coniospora]